MSLFSYRENGKVGHCLVNQDANAFGFGAASTDFPTLRSLIDHYATVSMKDHNPGLNVCLNHPVHPLAQK